MRSRNSTPEQVAEVARRRLELLSAELAGIRPGPADIGGAPVDGSGEPPSAPENGVGPANRRPGRHARRPVGATAAAGAWVQDRLPPTLQGRVQIGASHLTLVAVMVAAALGLTAWWALDAAGGEVAVPVSAPAGAPGTAASSSRVTPLVPVPASSAGPAVASPTGTVVVDVAGKVRHPGIVTLPVGSRVVDALEAAGGPRKGVRIGSLNLARVLVDGEQIVVGVRGPAGVAASAASAPGVSPGPLVDINTADQAALETLPGIGPVTAAAIIRWRTENGSFTAVDELLEVAGIGDATLAEMAPYVTL